MQVRVKLTGNLFEVELPDGEEIQFPNREGLDVINYVRVKGDFKLTSFKVYWDVEVMTYSNTSVIVAKHYANK